MTDRQTMPQAKRMLAHCYVFAVVLMLAAYGPAAAQTAQPALPGAAGPAQLPYADGRVQRLIDHYARAYHLRKEFVRRVVARESKGNPAARNGEYWGLMQISCPTAKTMGYRGPAQGLLDAETNLRYGVKYLAGAYRAADKNEHLALRLYASGFYDLAKRKGLLEATGLRDGPRALKTAPPLTGQDTPPARQP